MKARWALVLGISLAVLVLPLARGAGAQPAAPGAAEVRERLPGVELAGTLATATGIAITPLLGVSAVGAWQHWRTPPELRHRLPWYASKWFWIPGLAIGLLMVVKDPLLGLLPAAKKPLDALDVLENKASAVLAVPAVVPMFLSAFAPVQGLPSEEAAARAGLAVQSGLLEELPGAIAIGAAALIFVAAFLCVWLAFHVINVLILLSPFGPLDLVLRSVKALFLMALIGGTLVHPYLGLLVALAILAISIPLAGWSFRLMVFGAVMAADLVGRRHRRTRPDPERLRAFVVQRVGGARARTYGRVSLRDSTICFSYRPWLVLGRRSVELPAGSYSLGRGLVCPLVRLHEEGRAPLSVLRLPPRYRSHEERIASLLALSGVEEMPLVRGLKAIGSWLREMAGRGSRGATRLASQAREVVRS